MNRAERRRAAKEEAKKDTIYTLNREQFETMKMEIAKRTVVHSFVKMFGLSLMALHDEYGFGGKRLKVFAAKVMNLLDSFDKGYISFDDLEQTIKEETGFTFIDDKGKMIAKL